MPESLVVSLSLEEAFVVHLSQIAADAVAEPAESSGLYDDQHKVYQEMILP